MIREKWMLLYLPGYWRCSWTTVGYLRRTDLSIGRIENIYDFIVRSEHICTTDMIL